MLIFDYFFLIFVCNVIGGDGVPPDGVVFPTTTTTTRHYYYILHTTYNFPHILKKSIDSEDGTTVVNRKRHGLPRPQKRELSLFLTAFVSIRSL